MLESSLYKWLDLNPKDPKSTKIVRTIMLDAGLKHSLSNISIGKDDGASWNWASGNLSSINMNVGIDLKRAKAIMTLGQNNDISALFNTLEANNRIPNYAAIGITASMAMDAITSIASTYKNKEILGMNLSLDTQLKQYGYVTKEDLDIYNNRGLTPYGAIVGNAFKSVAMDLLDQPEYQPIFKKNGTGYDWKSDFPNKTYFDDEVKKRAKDLGYSYDNSYCNVLFYDSCIGDSSSYNFNNSISSPLNFLMDNGPGDTTIEYFQNALIKAANEKRYGIEYWADPKKGYDAAREKGLIFFSVTASSNYYHVAGVDITARWSNYEGGIVVQAGAMNGIYSLSNRDVYGNNWKNTQNPLPQAVHDPAAWKNDNSIYYFTMPVYSTVQENWRRYGKKK
jgi:hypothetical protein